METEGLFSAVVSPVVVLLLGESVGPFTNGDEIFEELAGLPKADDGDKQFPRECVNLDACLSTLDITEEMLQGDMSLPGDPSPEDFVSLPTVPLCLDGIP